MDSCELYIVDRISLSWDRST